MLKTILTGFLVGIANIIPGLSGGTMIVVFGLFDRLSIALASISNIKDPEWKSNILFILVFLLGAVLGMVSFAKLLDAVLLVHFSVQTFLFFVSLLIASFTLVQEDEMELKPVGSKTFLLYSVGIVFFLLNIYLNNIYSFGISLFIFIVCYHLVYKESDENKVNIILLSIGCLVIFVLNIFNQSDQEVPIYKVEELPSLNIILLISLLGMGMIAGASMIIPGLSGSLVLLILGGYGLVKSYLANITHFNMNILIPLVFVGIGAVLGILLLSKLIKYLLAYKRSQFMSFILGLIVSSTIVLIPTNIKFDIFVIITSIFSIIFGYFSVFYLSKLAKSNKNIIE